MTFRIIDNSKLNGKLEIIKSTEQEILVLNELGEEYKKYSEMSEQDRAFLNSLILRKSPKKILEIGVSKGGSSLVILNAIKNIENAHLYSLDYNTQCYRVPDKKTGFYVDNFPELKTKWKLKTGGLALNFLDEIGGDIDFCLIDTVHFNPGEILDVLMVLPYLKKDATIVFHDTNLHTRKDIDNPSVQYNYTNNLLMSALEGKKLIPSDTPFQSDFGFVNIGAIEINEQTFEHIFEVFNLLTIKWFYLPNDTDIKLMQDFLRRFYNEYYCDYFQKVVTFQKKHFALLEKLPARKVTFWEQIFSIKNENKHKVIRFLGLKIKIKR